MARGSGCVKSEGPRPEACPQGRRLEGSSLLYRVRRAELRSPGRAEVRDFGLQALDLEPQRCPAREGEHNDDTRRIRRLKFHAEQVQDSILVLWLYTAALHAVDPLEPQRGAPALILRLIAGGRLPIEP